MKFTSRSEAGEKLAEKLEEYKSPHTLILGIPRGGVVVAASLAKKLGVLFDVLSVKKLSAPHNPELAIGALAPDNVSYIEWRFAGNVGADEAYMKGEIEQKGQELKKQEKLFRKGRKPLNIKHKTVVLIDDGVATGSTMEAAIKWAKKKKAHKIAAAIPVAAPDTVKRIKPEVDELVVLEEPTDFRAVGQFYENFQQVENETVVSLLSK